MTTMYKHVIIYMTKLTIPLQEIKKTKDIREKTQTNAGECTDKIDNISATKSFRELKLVSNDCYDHILYIINTKCTSKNLIPTTDTDVYTDNSKRA